MDKVVVVRAKQIALKGLPPLLTVGILVALLMVVDFQGLLAALRRTAPQYVVLALSVTLLFSILLNADKWRRIVSSLGFPLSYKDALYLHLAGRPLSFILPLKCGEFAAAYYLKRRKGFSFRKTASSVLLDKYLMLLATVQLCLFGALILSLSDLRVVLVLSVLLTLTVVLIAPLHTPWVRAILSPIRSRFRKASDFLGDFTYAFKSITPGRLLFFLGYCHLVQLAGLAVFYLMFLAVGVRGSLSLGILLSYVPLIILLANLPITLSGLGTREALVMYFFRGYAAPETLIAVGILVSLVEYAFPAAVGVVFQLRFIKRLLEGAKLK